mmetsp:Transcript_24122/g.50416  ORF Transcript_24122/g.50416 Transcript_24122/m.50416 type:complete len:173 (-) Transcript_24122:63-581(-)
MTGKRSGQGEYLGDCGDQYLGEWSSNDRNGFGTFKSTRGQGSYYGLWVDGKRHGKGELVFDNGDVYAGSFERNKLHGYGVMTYGKGHKYVGEWRNNHRDGEGQLSDGGELYQGYWSMGERHGFGKQLFADRQCYEGEWHRDRFHGIGALGSAASGPGQEKRAFCRWTDGHEA